MGAASSWPTRRTVPTAGGHRPVHRRLCVSRRLIIEVVGAVHDARRDLDEGRDRTLAALGWRILRVRNEDVLTDLDAVLGRIVNDLKG